MLYLNTSGFNSYCLTNNSGYSQKEIISFWLEYDRIEIFPEYTLFLGKDQYKRKYKYSIYNVPEMIGYEELKLEHYSYLKDILDL
jgi:hypothetical protein